MLCNVREQLWCRFPLLTAIALSAAQNAMSRRPLHGCWLQNRLWSVVQPRYKTCRLTKDNTVDKTLSPHTDIYKYASGLPSLEGHLVNFCLASKEDEHIPSGFIQVDVHGSVHSCCQVVLCVVLLAVHYLNLKGTPWHSEDGAVIEVGAELLPIQGG